MRKSYFGNISYVIRVAYQILDQKKAKNRSGLASNLKWIFRTPKFKSLTLKCLYCALGNIIYGIIMKIGARDISLKQLLAKNALSSN